MKRPWITSESYKAALDVIIETRKQQGLTQRDLSSRLGKPQSFVAKIESRERRLDFLEFIAVARALGFEPVELMALVVAAVPGTLEF